MSKSSTIDPIVSVPREQYLLKNETRIRDLALPAKNSDPAVAVHLQIVLFQESIQDRHEVAVTANRNAHREHMARDHQAFADMAYQTKLHHLSQLASLLL
jgi:hypothetical protein